MRNTPEVEHLQRAIVELCQSIREGKPVLTQTGVRVGPVLLTVQPSGVYWRDRTTMPAISVAIRVENSVAFEVDAKNPAFDVAAPDMVQCLVEWLTETAVDLAGPEAVRGMLDLVEDEARAALEKEASKDA